MSTNQTVIYAAPTALKAHALRNLLADAQIQAVLLSDQPSPAAAADLPSGSTLIAVAVPNEDAPRARHIALQFDRQGVYAAAGPTPEDAAPTQSTTWPRCPQCDAPRSTRCPICGTAGCDFAPVDMGFTWIPGPQDPHAATSCSCAPDACPANGAPADADVPNGEQVQDWADNMVICSTCDEPFRPEYPRRCEWCGHEFDDGLDVDATPARQDQLNARVVAAILALLALLLGFAVYFLSVVSPG
jgi:uncharacterized paraquat-inducible protein A